MKALDTKFGTRGFLLYHFFFFQNNYPVHYSRYLIIVGNPSDFFQIFEGHSSKLEWFCSDKVQMLLIKRTFAEILGDNINSLYNFNKYSRSFMARTSLGAMEICTRHG